MKQDITIHWFRRDLRLEDNTALNTALKGQSPVLPLFIFDTNILDELAPNDARVNFIHKQLQHINKKLKLNYKSSVLIKYGNPIDIFQELAEEFNIESVHFNRDYEPYAIKRDKFVTDFLQKQSINVINYKDHVVFEAHEILKKDASPYTVYTPYKKQWLKHFKHIKLDSESGISDNFLQQDFNFPPIELIGFRNSCINVPDYTLLSIDRYAEERDFPYLDSTSYLGPHLRFGTVSVRQILLQLKMEHTVFLSELIWREFFMQILFHFPYVVTQSFRKQYDDIKWRNNEVEFERWCQGQTGYPLVDAGMRQLNTTGCMHNRVRMVCASFLCKHLLIDWRWGEAYFANKLLDYELASNNGNWQWAAGTGCDAAPYFRIFNPTEQQRKFDPDFSYVRQWIEEFDTTSYPKPMVEHVMARKRALETYQTAVKK
ncbi:deoxyribodipyrimidine photo-lyase [Carboxylicivirga sp. A043]|uniref:cryptochrome/photolyase family protein n=1 Tax=Carboxylicivirga litoralis TaxID=2816963 RepID=UPI0021CAF0F5|nr:deoxyribodipyrimidine photo-lyase [Carboxylicivirga sp. A043]MCU4157299.1 deoxyribodipyrimidine photo-lyase [Carboxylicivirga sp. A043]